MPNKPHHGMRGLGKRPAPLHAGTNMPLRKPSGGDRTAKQMPTARNGALAGGSLKASGTSDTRRRSGAEGNSKGTVARGEKTAGTASHMGTSGRGALGAMNQTHSNRLSENPTHEWFEALGAK